MTTSKEKQDVENLVLITKNCLVDRQIYRNQELEKALSVCSSLLKSSEGDIQSLKHQEEFQDMKVSVDKESLVVREERISTKTRVGLDTSKHKSWNQFI